MFDSTMKDSPMLVRDEYERKLHEYIRNPEIRIINIWGESGLGKTVLAQQFCESHKDSLNIGTFDFNQYTGMSDQVMISGLYDLASTILKKRIATSLNEFTVADAVSSKRDGRIPLAQRGVDSGLDFIIQMDEIVEGFLPIPYLGTGLKTAKAVKNTVQYFLSRSGENKDLYDKYDAMNDDELNEALPSALADDLNIQAYGQFRSIIAVDNYNKSRAGAWFEKLVSCTKSIIWLIISEKLIERNSEETGYIQVGRLTENEMDIYLKDNCGINVEITREKIKALSNGSIFIIREILDVLDGRMEMDNLKWDSMQRDGITHITSNLFNALSQENREILIQLSFARYFDEDLFHRLFPGRIFEMYRSWFRGSMFSDITENRFTVQSGMKKEVISYVDNVNGKIANECKKNLFNAVKDRLVSFRNKDGEMTLDIKDELNSLLSYGKSFQSEDFYVQTIISMRSLFLYSGGSRLYLDVLRTMMNELKNASEQFNNLHIKKVRASVLFELALTEFQTGFYEDAYKHMNEGIAFAKNLEDNVLLQKFIGIQMKLINISPQITNKNNDSILHVIMLSKEYLELLETNRESLTYKEYIQYKISACLFQSDEYRARQDFDSARNCLMEALEICSDPSTLRLLELFRLYACTLEHIGVIEESLGNYQKARENYIKSIEQYRLSELLESSWDSDFYLSWGLVLKRLGETEFYLEGLTESSFDNIDKALNKYKMVSEQNPDTIDTYCKIGFACTDSMKKILSLPESSFNSLRNHFESYLKKCKEAINEANKYMISNSQGNRQICNITCSLYQNEGVFLHRCGEIDKARNAFCKALESGQDAVRYFSNHPYSYLGLANACLSYKNFLKATGEKDAAEEYTRKGIDAINTARTFTSDENSFSDIYEKLLEK